MKFLISILFLFYSSTFVYGYDDSAVLEVNDFQKLAKQMQQNKMGLVLMMHAEYCAYCEMMDEKILSPMERSGEYKQRVFIRKLQIDKPESVTDFVGADVDASDLAYAYDSRLTPTLLFLDHNGEEKAVKIIGINSVELFNASVDEQIDELLQTIHGTAVEKTKG